MTWVGKLLGKRYRLGQLVAAGAMGEVYEAVDLRAANEPVIIKVLRAEYRRNRDLYARLKREANIAASLSSRYVAKLHRVEVEPQHGRIWLVFEFLDGESLDGCLEREGKLPLQSVAWIIEQTLLALNEIHGAGVVHRDISPRNLLLATSDRRLWVLDFGLAKPLRAESASVTDVDEILGTPAYMSPEQFADSRAVDRRSDLYSVGVVAYRALTGRLPFRGRDVHTMMAAKSAGEFSPLWRVTGETWPEQMEHWLEAALASEPEHRFASAALALQQWIEAYEIAEHWERKPIAPYLADTETSS